MRQVVVPTATRRSGYRVTEPDGGRYSARTRRSGEHRGRPGRIIARVLGHDGVVHARSDEVGRTARRLGSGPFVSELGGARRRGGSRRQPRSSRTADAAPPQHRRRADVERGRALPRDLRRRTRCVDQSCRWSLDRRAGASGTPSHVDAWISSDRETWSPLPDQLYGGAGEALSMVAAIDGRIVVVGTAPRVGPLLHRHPRRARRLARVDRDLGEARARCWCAPTRARPRRRPRWGSA